MIKFYFKKMIMLVILSLLFLVGCNDQKVSNEDKVVKVGIMLSDVGLGDQSFSDMAFTGLERARDEMGIEFNYMELNGDSSYEQGLTKLVEEKPDLVIGLGFAMQEDLEKVAKAHPDQSFLFIDGVSELENIHSITFKEDEGAYLVGVLASFTSKTNTYGFIGGMDVPVIERFRQGFEHGIKRMKPDANLLVDYTNDFGNQKKGEEIAVKMMNEGADMIFPAAGLSGLGAIHATAKHDNVFSFGVDTDQFFFAENTVISSMLKKVDIAIYQAVKELNDNGKLLEKHKVLGIKENGVGLAPIRNTQITPTIESEIEKAKQDIINGTVTIKSE
ncbi:BMP family lipoprotein [Litchfieldia salsa]|uniref:Nucleoside-binding protein n=1 Tax=Litchfieldia salsa TaxID=930152 RepID=A0A1H0TBB7_9BACI|nr:BMP family ABC transporter substrate-binding protein [Litchfieldia salsa]SDP51101.1 nucleoside-binding protein [Litchfieldia salsa]